MSTTQLLENLKQSIVDEVLKKINQPVKQEEVGWGDLDWLKQTTSIKSTNELQDKILIPFRKELEPTIVRYGGKGKSYLVNKPRMKIWLEENFERVWK